MERPPIPLRPSYDPNPRTIVDIALIIALIGIAVWAGLGVFQMREGSAAAVIQSGKTRIVSEPGFHWSNPPGLAQSSVDKVAMQQPEILEMGFRTVTAGSPGQSPVYKELPDEAEVLTSDRQYLHVEVVVQLLPTDPYLWTFQVSNRDVLVRQTVHATLMREVARHSFTENRNGQVQSQLQKAIQIDLDQLFSQLQLGAKVQSINLQNVSAPKEVRDAYNAISQAESQAKEAVQKAQQTQNTDIPKAQAESASMKAEADKYYATTVGAAKGNVQQFTQWYQQYQQNPALASAKTYWESMQELLKKDGVQIYIVDDKGTLKYLPLGQ